ncbi:hypothetical protein PAXRUDRAFT_666778 [Paxillus rubicundulus Ve08.2h10]|uniref:Uncharacterized protein n=1 Tax=Paxillus rubicundulus Ve08.2h10 TaxID=930991 RepID=A0A0D0DRY9_9AGAM|nr:hypothetical protein PAXRUDRAFT_666778 [Paxillus rubicundulus Ve08.2h10]
MSREPARGVIQNGLALHDCQWPRCRCYWAPGVYVLHLPRQTSAFAEQASETWPSCCHVEGLACIPCQDEGSCGVLSERYRTC